MALRTTRQMVEVLGTGDNGEMRVTRQSVAVLGTPSGTVRVYRQMIEVLAAEAGGDIFDVRAENVLSLSGGSESGFIFTCISENTLALDQESYLNLESLPQLSVGDQADVSVAWSCGATSENTIDHALAVSVVYDLAVSSDLEIAQGLEYIGPKLIAARNTLEFAQKGYLCQKYERSAQSSLALAVSSDSSGTIRASATSDLALTGLADHKVYVRRAASELELVNEAVGDYCHTAGNALVLSDGAVQGQITVRAVTELSVAQTARTNPITIGPGPNYNVYLPPTEIAFQQTVLSSIHMLQAQSVLSLSDDLDVKQPFYRQAVNELQTITQVFDPDTVTFVDVISGLRGSASAYRIAYAPYVNHHYLQISHSANVVNLRANGVSKFAENTLAISDEASKNETALAVNWIQVSSQVAVDFCKPATTVVELSQSAVVNAERSIIASSFLAIKHGLTHFLISGHVLCNYHPFIGEGGEDAPAPPPASLTGPIPGVTVPFQLFYPAAEPTESVTLRCPNLGNKDRLSFNRVLRETRGGTLICYADPIWPKIQTLVLSFSGLEATEKDALLTFMEDHLGLEIGLLDWEHRYWKGVVVTPNAPAVQDDRDSFSVSFEFEGEMDLEWAL